MPLRHHSQRTGRARKPSERRQESSAIDHGVPLRATCADSTRELRPQQQTFIPYPRFWSQPRLPARTRPSSRRLSCHFHLQIAVFTRNTARVITCDLYFSPPAFSFFHGRKLR